MTLSMGYAMTCNVVAQGHVWLFTGFTVFATVHGTMCAFQNFLGFAHSIFVGGEVKQVNRSQGIGILGSTLVLGLVGRFMKSAMASGLNSCIVLPILR